MGKERERDRVGKLLTSNELKGNPEKIKLRLIKSCVSTDSHIVCEEKCSHAGLYGDYDPLNKHEIYFSILFMLNEKY